MSLQDRFLFPTYISQLLSGCDSLAHPATLYLYSSLKLFNLHPSRSMLMWITLTVTLERYRRMRLYLSEMEVGNTGNTVPK